MSPRFPLNERTPVLAHIHVPKSSGSSLRKALDTTFSQAAHLWLYFDHDTDFVYHDDQIADLVTEPSVRAFSSHFVRRFPPELAQRRMHYVTFLREPVQQFISYITYTKKHYAAIKHPVLLSQLPPDMPNLSIQECARWILAGDQTGFRNFRENYATNFFARYTVLESSGFSYSDARYRAIRLDAAREVLNKFLFTGISERMDESWRLLRSKAAAAGIWLPDMGITHENVSAEMRDGLSWVSMDDSVGRALLTSVAEDQQLYRWAVDRFDEQIRDL
ncbi:MAG: hypothetical protein M3Z09_06240 [Acidobacteriota bacterium]|nr:hypothetical protein [Acidobacteriota bacterium]